MRVRDVMDPPTHRVDALADHARLLDAFRVHPAPALPVTKNHGRSLVGTIELRDLFDPEGGHELTGLLDPNAATTYPEASLEEAAPLFVRFHARILPVTNAQNDLLGVLRPGHALAGVHPPRTRIAPHLHHGAVPVHAATPLAVVREILRVTRATALPVLDDQGEVLGLLHPVPLLDPSVQGVARDVMDSHPHVVDPGTFLADVTARFRQDPLDVLVVADAHGRLVDVISDADALRIALDAAAPPQTGL